MDRRRFVAAIGGALAAPLVRAQASRRPYRIGLLVAPNPAGWFVTAMKERGWLEDRDYVLVRPGIPYSVRQAEDSATRILAEKPDLIVVQTTAIALAAHRQTATVPIVMWVSGYPVEVGLANSLRKPGKNVTGNSIYAGTGIWGKLVQILRDAKPAMKRVGVLWGYAPPTFLREEIDLGQQEIRKTASTLGLTTQLVENGKPEEALPSIAQLERAGADALIIAGRSVLGDYREKAVELCIAKRLPVIVDSTWPVGEVPYPLFAFGAVLDDLMSQAASYVVQILGGAKPGDLPIQQPTRVELWVYLKTARAIGLAIPQSLLLRADRVIE